VSVRRGPDATNCWCPPSPALARHPRWPDRRWEWAGLVADNADFETPADLDLEARDRWFAQAIVASPAMFRRVEGGGSLYWLGARDEEGAYLDGGRDYRLSIPLPVPGSLFWSITIYDAQTRSQVQAEQNLAALRSLFELQHLPSAGTADLHFGPTAPTDDSGTWLQTVPGCGWFAYIRIYGPETPAFDGSWKPGISRPSPDPWPAPSRTTSRLGVPARAERGLRFRFSKRRSSIHVALGPATYGKCVVGSVGSSTRRCRA
jgi:hypothetical protein